MIQLFPSNTNGPSFHVHTALLACRTTYFEQRYEDLDSLDVTASVLSLFVDWVYSDFVPRVDPQGSCENLMQLFHLYLLAQKLCADANLGDLVMNRIRQGYRRCPRHPPSQETIRHYYSKAGIKSPLRRFLVKYVAWSSVNGKLDLEEFRSLIEEGGSFALDLVLALNAAAASAPLQNPVKEADCRYHNHAENVQCTVRNLVRGGRYLGEVK